MGKPGFNITGTDADDVLTGSRNDDRMYGYLGNDEMHGGDGNDELQGHEGNDSLYGDAGNDTLVGGYGNDVLDGGAGNDKLVFGPGSDTVTGGSGADNFVFAVTSDGTRPIYDGLTTITDFESGIDKLDLSHLDADLRTAPGIITGNKTPGNEAFHIVGSSDGATPGDLVISTGLDDLGRPVTILTGYTDTNPGAEFEIHLLGLSPSGGPIIGAGDILL
jgi:Ca2+-binding RTX toxin-like protein